MTTATRFASMDDFDRGGVEIIGNDSARRYLFSNMFDVAKRAAPWERVVVAKNLEFTIECARAEGDSPWYICAHDETALSMQGDMEIHFIEPADSSVQPPVERTGALRLAAAPKGRTMGNIRMGRGHMALLPRGAAYQIRPKRAGVVLLQSVLGAESIERWAEICQH